MLLTFLLVHTAWVGDVTTTPINSTPGINNFLSSTTTFNNAVNARNNFEPSSPCPGEQRAVWDITWSCLVTLFACTWLGIHPNVPPGMKWWSGFRRRLILWLYALVAPETIVFWAMKQWYAAGAYAEKYQAQGWTRTHGFFLIMGGFVIYDQHCEPKGGPRTVSPPDFDDMLVKNLIVFPTITEDEIQDRSKGDILSKTIVAVQTLWFVLQCVARAQQDLAITELEVVTLALAALNAVMYFMWWHKPLDAKCPVTLIATQSTALDADAPAQELEDTDPSQAEPPPLSTTRNTSQWFTAICILSLILKFVKHVLTVLVSFPFIVLALVFTAILPLNAMTGNVENSLPGLYARFRDTDTPLFYAPKISRKRSMFTFALLIAAAFGSIHCVAWNFTFITPLEKVLWRIASAVITVLPLGYLLLHTYDWADEAGILRLGIFASLKQLFRALRCWPTLQSAPSILHRIKVPKIIVNAVACVVDVTFIMGFAACVVLYVIARLYMIIEAFVSLRSLPLNALQEVAWTKYIPHV